MQFQDSSFNGLKVTVGTKKCDPPTDPRTHAPKAICPINFFKVGGINMISRYQWITSLTCYCLACMTHITLFIFIWLRCPYMC